MGSGLGSVTKFFFFLDFSSNFFLGFFFFLGLESRTDNFFFLFEGVPNFVIEGVPKMD